MITDLRHIEAFLAVVRCGNFTRAAASLCVSQPALTVQVKQLEASLGVRLFDRNNRNVALTQIGRGLVAPLERVLLDLESIVDGAHDAASHRRGVVTVACLPSIAADMLRARSHDCLIRLRRPECVEDFHEFLCGGLSDRLRPVTTPICLVSAGRESITARTARVAETPAASGRIATPSPAAAMPSAVVM